MYMCMAMCAGFLAQKLGTPGAGKKEGRNSKEKSTFKEKGKWSKPKHLSAYKLPSKKST